ncbi:unnamed protein product [Anisakis simplex]|uniref:MARVEL domain-containing protein n=1 Tax=Anisakis simplex TaxID=6269 RepID=A0A0M3K5V5_ANISI|nr:unnamed protein product [Anisakis simplex]
MKLSLARIATKIISICMLISLSLYAGHTIYRGNISRNAIIIIALMFTLFGTLASGAFFERKRLLIPFITVQGAFVCTLIIAFGFLSATLVMCFLNKHCLLDAITNERATRMPLLTLMDVLIAASIVINYLVFSVVVRSYCFLKDRERIMATPITTPGFDDNKRRRRSEFLPRK